MNAVIIEDEKQAVIALKQELKETCPEVVIKGDASTVKSGIKLILDEQPEIVFLDVQLKDGTGFDLLHEIGEYNFKVIFTTAYSEYAIQAIKISALDYLLKPIQSNQLSIAIQKVLKSNLDSMKTQIASLIHNRDASPLGKKIALPTSQGISLYAFDSIIRIQSEGNYSAIYLDDDKKIIVAKTLRDFEELLMDHGFVRIHHSHLINLHHLAKYYSKDGGYVVMQNNETIPVSKRKKAELLKFLNNG